MARGSKIAARELMQRLAYDPIDEQVKIAMDASTSRELRAAIARDLTPYMYPRLNSMTVSGDEDGEPIKIDARGAFVKMVLGSPELADAAQKLSLAAAEIQEGD